MQFSYVQRRTFRDEDEEDKLGQVGTLPSNLPVI
jgi:hypothetical protein